jgi:dihydroorotate dehydrogenase (fumarate)
MAKLTTKYMGIELKNPLIVGACSLTSDLDAIKRIEDAGAGSFVIKSLFE